MIDEILVFDDLFDSKFADEMEDLMLGPLNVPWFLLNNVTTGYSAASATAPASFVHTFNNTEEVFSPGGLELLKVIAETACKRISFPIRRYLHTRSFLQVPPRDGGGTPNPPHVDTDRPHLVCLYYVNDTEGPTLIYEQTISDIPITKAKDATFTVLRSVTPKKGRCVLFNGKHYHSSSSPETRKRCIINFDLG